MKYLLWLSCFYGVYTAMMQAWQWSEKFELGYTIVTKTDTAICMVMSMIVTMVIIMYSDLE